MGERGRGGGLSFTSLYLSLFFSSSTQSTYAVVVQLQMCLFGDGWGQVGGDWGSWECLFEIPIMWQHSNLQSKLYLLMFYNARITGRPGNYSD